MKDELMRELFEKWARSQPTRLKGKSSWQDLEMRPNGNYKNCAHHYAWQGFRAACQLFAPHIEILEDDAEPMVGDFVKDKAGKILRVDEIKNNVYWHQFHGYQSFTNPAECELYSRANNKACIKAKDLIGNL